MTGLDLLGADDFFAHPANTTTNKPTSERGDGSASSRATTTITPGQLSAARDGGGQVTVESKGGSWSCVVPGQGKTCPAGYEPWADAFDEKGNQLCWPTNMRGVNPAGVIIVCPPPGEAGADIPGADFQHFEDANGNPLDANGNPLSPDGTTTTPGPVDPTTPPGATTTTPSPPPSPTLASSSLPYVPPAPAGGGDEYQPPSEEGGYEEEGGEAPAEAEYSEEEGGEETESSEAEAEAELNAIGYFLASLGGTNRRRPPNARRAIYKLRKTATPFRQTKPASKPTGKPVAVKPVVIKPSTMPSLSRKGPLPVKVKPKVGSGLDLLGADDLTGFDYGALLKVAGGLLEGGAAIAEGKQAEGKTAAETATKLDAAIQADRDASNAAAKADVSAQLRSKTAAADAVAAKKAAAVQDAAETSQARIDAADQMLATVMKNAKAKPKDGYQAALLRAWTVTAAKAHGNVAGDAGGKVKDANQEPWLTRRVVGPIPGYGVVVGSVMLAGVLGLIVTKIVLRSRVTNV